MIYKKISIFIVVLILLVSCKEKSKKQEPINATSGYETLSADKMYEYKLKAISKGDTVAYNEILADYIMMNRERDFLYYSLIMSNKNNYPRAAYDVYFILTNRISKDSLKNKLDSATYNFALAYLKNAAKHGYESAMSELEMFKK